MNRMINIQPHFTAQEELHGLLVRAASAVTLLQELALLNVSPTQHPVYPVPGNEPNSLWGGFIELDFDKALDTRQHSWCQRLRPGLYIPRQSRLFPQLTPMEQDRFFAKDIHIFHPEFNYAVLSEAINWEKVFKLPPETEVSVQAPAKPLFIPLRVKSAEIVAMNPEETLEQWLKEVIANPENFEDKPLSPGEKIKLRLLKNLFTEDKDGKVQPSKVLQQLQRLFGMDKGTSMEQLREEYEELMRRNQKELDKLMDLFKKNPEEALKYAIPIDQKGTERGPTIFGEFKMNPIWASLALFGSMIGGAGGGSGGGGSLAMPGDQFNQLERQYRQTAEEFLRNRAYKKAAFIYLNLLKEPSRAASILQEGKYYAEAASIYLKHLQNKRAAANCYNLGKHYRKATELYEELGEHEKCGDIYQLLNETEKALSFFEIVQKEHIRRNRFVDAAHLSQHKMRQLEVAQELRLKGWRAQHKPYLCLNDYFDNIEDPELAKVELERIYHNEIAKGQDQTFLNILKQEYQRRDTSKPLARSMAYQLVAKLVRNNRQIVRDLGYFNNDPKLKRDVHVFTNRSL